MVRPMLFVLVAATAAACSSDPVPVNATAQRAYFGLDSSIRKSIDVGLSALTISSSANITPFTLPGEMGGKLIVAGQVDPGTANFKTVRLAPAYNGYSNDGSVAYDTIPSSLPLLALVLKNAPYGTMSGTFEGVFHMTGALSDTLTLELAIEGPLQPAGPSGVERAPYSTRISGTAVSGYGRYDVDFTR